MSIDEDFNPVIDELFKNLSNSISNPPQLFISNYPEHQFEGKYQLQPGDIYVEAGAFWGRYGLVASHRVGPKGKVILIEPNPGNVQKIKEVISRYDLRNVTVVNCAIGKEDGDVWFSIHGNPAGGHVVAVAEPLVIKVQAYKLDTLLQQLNISIVNLLSCDVEGAEFDLVQGAENYLRQHKIKNLALCAYHIAGMPKKIMDYIASLGYKNLYYNPFKPQVGGIVYSSVY